MGPATRRAIQCMNAPQCRSAQRSAATRTCRADAGLAHRNTRVRLVWFDSSWFDPKRRATRVNNARRPAFLLPAVLVVEPDDIVFAQIRTRLHFDHFEGHLARVLEP